MSTPDPFEPEPKTFALPKFTQTFAAAGSDTADEHLENHLHLFDQNGPPRWQMSIPSERTSIRRAFENLKNRGELEPVLRACGELSDDIAAARQADEKLLPPGSKVTIEVDVNNPSASKITVSHPPPRDPAAEARAQSSLARLIQPQIGEVAKEAAKMYQALGREQGRIAERPPHTPTARLERGRGR